MKKILNKEKLKMNDMPDQEKMQIAEAHKPILEPIEVN